MIGLSELAPKDDIDWAKLMGAVPDSVLISNHEGIIVYVNSAVERDFGYKPQSLLGKTIETLIPIDLQQRHKIHRGNFHVAPRRRTMGAGRDLRAIRANGTEFPVKISLGFSPTSHGNLVVAIVQDLSLIRAQEESVEKLTHRMAQAAKLSEVNKELEAFSFSVSHDLRSPLRVVDGFSQMLLEDYASHLDEHGQNCIHRIRLATQRMGQLIDDLLNLSRITRTEMNAQRINVTNMVHEIIGFLKDLDAKSDIDIAVQNDMVATGDANLLRIAFENLLSNAWKFTAGRPLPRIEVGQRTKNGNSVFYVTDNGAGFDMAYAEKLFGAFQRMSNAKNFPGTGIGLATVQRIIHRHSGRIWAESEIDKGTTIHFTLFQEENDERHEAQYDFVG